MSADKSRLESLWGNKYGGKTILELKFEEEIRDKMFLAKKECNYNPTRFHQMINNHGGCWNGKKVDCTGAKNRKYIRWIYHTLSLR